MRRAVVVIPAALVSPKPAIVQGDAAGAGPKSAGAPCQPRPTSGLDPIRSRDISTLIRTVAKKINAATVITSHDIDNSFRIADKLVILNEGRIAAMGTVDEIKANPEGFVKEFIRS